MPQIKSQKKRVKTNNKAHKLIVSQKSALKTRSEERRVGKECAA